MTKKKNGIFSKIKDKLRKGSDEEYEDEYETELEDSEDDEYEYVDEDEEDDDDEYEYVDEDEDEESAEVEEVVASQSDDDDEEDDDEYEYEDEDEDDDGYEELPDGTIEIEIEEPAKPGLMEKLKSKFSKNKDEDDDFEYEDDDLEEQIEGVAASNKNAVQNMIDRFKNLKPSIAKRDEPKPSTSSRNFSELSAEQWIPHLLGTQNRETIHRAFIIGLTTTSFFFGGKFVGLWLGSTKKSKGFTPRSERVAFYNPRPDVNLIRDNNIFNAKESLSQKPKVTKKKEPEVKICKAANRKSSLPLKLVNTIVLQDSVKSVASVSKRGKIFNFREGEKIDGMAEVGKIDRLKLVFKNLRSGSCEYIENVDKKAKRAFAKKKLKVEPARPLKKEGIQGVGNKYTIKKSVRDQLLSNIGEVLTQARAIQIKNPDGTLAFKMTDVVPGSIYSQLDIQNNDIVTGINGKKITSLNELMSMFGKLKENDAYDITIKRNGNEKTLNYNFTE
jgi:type II secretion system protein C